ncbi:MAG: hypothetical protein H7Y15_10410, partial [Pseudonocardia sp.]|nr:hypothetical protein [Pseudonocardia sp.]
MIATLITVSITVALVVFGVWVGWSLLLACWDEDEDDDDEDEDDEDGEPDDGWDYEDEPDSDRPGDERSDSATAAAAEPMSIPPPLPDSSLPLRPRRPAPP